MSIRSILVFWLLFWLFFVVLLLLVVVFVVVVVVVVVVKDKRLFYKIAISDITDLIVKAY